MPTRHTFVEASDLVRVFSTAEGESSERWTFGGSRADVIAKAAAYAMDLARRNLGNE
jgi:hypothetical protein